MTQEEHKKAKAEEERAAMQAELEQLRKDKVVQEYTAQFLGLGYDKDLAKAAVEALESGDMQTVFYNQTKFSTAREEGFVLCSLVFAGKGWYSFVSTEKEGRE